MKLKSNLGLELNLFLPDWLFLSKSKKIIFLNI